MRTCIRCGNELQEGRCDACLSFDHCDVCGKAMPKEAKRCNACGSYKHLGFLPQLGSIMTVIGGIAVAISAIYSGCNFVRTLGSHTDFRFATANEKAIAIKVWNTGSKPSVLIGYRLKFDELPDDRQMTLELSNGDTAAANGVIAAGTAPVTVWLEPDPRGKQYTEADVKALHESPSPHKVTLYVDVGESLGGRHTLEDHFTEDRIAAFLPANLRGGP